MLKLPNGNSNLKRKKSMLSHISRWILNLLGWNILKQLPESPKYVAIAAPHTSNWDFPLGILTASAMQLKISWIGKHTLFHWPYGWFFRAIGGIPIERGTGANLSQQMAARFANSDSLVLAIAPEGTRSKLDHWKTGFYYIATAANVPIALACLDYKNKEVGISAAFEPSGDIQADFEIIREYYRDKVGKFPAKASSIQARR